MRLLITSCLIALFSFSAQADEKKITIEASIISKGELRSVWTALKITLITNGYNQCQMVYAGIKIDCSVRTINPDSFADSDALITMNKYDFAYLATSAAKNVKLPEELNSQFYKNISDYSLNYDTLSNQPAVSFLLKEGDDTQENTFNSSDGKTISIVRVTRH